MNTTVFKKTISVFLSLLIVLQLGVVTLADDTGVEGFVTRLYEKIMDREPDQGGLDHWTAKLKDGSYTASNIVDFFFTSDEFKAKNLNDAEYIDILYATLMGRASDPDGVNYWLNQLATGSTRRRVLSEFVWSPEFSGICETYGVTRGEISLSSIDKYPQKAYFIAQLYRAILNREPDTNGLKGWVDYTLTGHTACQVISGLISSPEFQNRNLSDYDYIACLYRALLGREGSSTEINGWLNNMITHQYSRTLILKQIAQSPEFSGICSAAGVTVGDIVLSESRDKNITINDYIINSYNSLLGRAPSNDDLNYWAAALLSSSCAKDFQNALIASQEFKNRNLSSEEFVTAFFKSALGREASADDITNYANMIDTQGQTVFLNFIYATNEFATYCGTIGLPSIYHEGWNNSKGGKIYISGGKLLSGWQRIDNKRYYFNPQNGNVAATGWTYVGGFKYYFNSDGSLCQDIHNLIGKQSEYYLTVNCRTNTVTVYTKDENGNFVVPVKAMICSTGANGATPAGSFTTRRLMAWNPLMGDVWGQYCTQVNGNILFHSVWYYQNGNANTQSVKEYNKLGTSCSHGCIRLTTADAKWIYDNCNRCTVTVTYDANASAPFDRPTPPPITALYGDYGHDPTDIWS